MRGQGAMELQWCPGDRVRQLQLGGVEEMARKSLPAMAGWAAVAAITHEWVASSGHVQPNLVRTPRMGERLNQRGGRAADHELQPRVGPTNAPTAHG